MKLQKRFRKILATLALLGLVACGQPKAMATPGQTPPPGQASSPAATPPTAINAPTEVIKGLNSFSYKLYQPVAKSLQGNLAVSPIGSYILLGLLHEGAVGPAKAEIEAVIGLPKDGLPAMAKLVSGLDERQSLALAQKIYIDSSVSLVPAFQAAVAPLLADPVQALSFSADAVAATKVINDWVEQKTSGFIKDFLPTLPAETSSVLVSALHFKGNWKSQFDKKATRPAEFHPTPTETLTVPMMVQEDVRSVEVAGGTAVILPYEEDFDMLFLLPKPEQSLDDLAKRLDLTALPRQTRGGAKVILELPRFEFTVPTFQLTDAWRETGLEQTVTRPDLSGMFENAPDNLEIKVFHKTYIRVDEEGTEAAAATGAVVAITSVPAPPAVLTFDRPFMFVLRHSGTGAVLMLGRVERPEEATSES
jgi:serpin B